MTYLVDHHCEYGIYQLSNEDSYSWYEFACEILKDKDVEVAPVTSEEYPQKAYRPRHSIMSLKKSGSHWIYHPNVADCVTGIYEPDLKQSLIIENNESVNNLVYFSKTFLI